MTDRIEGWKTVHQPFELRYHQHRNFRWKGYEKKWDDQWNNVFNFFGELQPDSVTDDHVLLDIGCGSRPVLDWFKGGQKHFLDPLLDDFVKIPEMAPFWAVHEHKYSLPAEVFVPELEGRCDFVLSWNVIDHSYSPLQIIENIHRYMKVGGVFLLGTDLHEREHLGHPGIGSKTEFLADITGRFTVLKESRKGFPTCRDIALLLRKD